LLYLQTQVTEGLATDITAAWLLPKTRVDKAYYDLSVFLMIERDVYSFLWRTERSSHEKQSNAVLAFY
jgi:hypothetical protein